MKKILYRTRNNKMICGVCNGIAEYFDMDPSIIRVLAVIAAFVSLGTAILAYIIIAIILPEQD